MRLMINPQLLWRYSWKNFQKGLAMFKAIESPSSMTTPE
jgi:hypothetical protein